MLDRGNYDEIRRWHLGPGEALLWEGAPAQGLRIAAWDVYPLFVGLIAVVFSLGIVVNFFPRLDVIGVAAFMATLGAYIGGGRLWFDAKRRSRTLYALTSRNLFIASFFQHGDIKGLELKTLRRLTLSERADGSGVIEFGTSTWFTKLYAMSNVMPDTTPRLVLASDARHVYDMIQQARDDALGA